MPAMSPRSHKVLRWSTLAAVASGCILLLVATESVVRLTGKARPGSLGSLVVCRLPSGEEVLWGPYQNEKKPEGSRELGNIEVMLDFPVPSGPYGRWTQPYEVWIKRGMRSASSGDAGASFSDATMVQKHAMWLNDVRLHRIAREVQTQNPPPDPLHTGVIARRYTGTLIVWQAVWMSAFRVVLLSAAAMCVFVALRWVYLELHRRPGQCKTCGYDLRGLPTDSPCPECGVAR